MELFLDKTESGGKKVKGYQEIAYRIWSNEWIELGLEQNIVMNDEIIQEITLCVFSLAQHTEYNDQRNHAGKIDLFQWWSVAVERMIKICV